MYKKLNQILENFNIVPFIIDRNDFLGIFAPAFRINGVRLSGLILNL